MQRLGLKAADTSEAITAARREERKRFKNERARKEREVIEEKLMEELLVEKIAIAHGSTESGKPGKPTLRSKYEGLAEAALLSPTKGIGMFCGERVFDFRLPTPPTTPTPEDSVEPETKLPAAEATPNKEETVRAKDEPIINGEIEKSQQPKQEEDPSPRPQEIENQEHLQLTPEEAFFLAYALGILDIYPEPPIPKSAHDPTTATATATKTDLLTSSHLLTLFTNYNPPLFCTYPLQPDSPFFLLYTAYHHFRSLGWVVRPGLKFGVDYLLYLRGPVFSHAEFAVTVLPAYTHPFWRQTEQGREMLSRSGCDKDTSWHWMHCVQRVQSQVRKTLVVAWVDVPPPLENGEMDVTSFMKRYKVREMIVKRWIPNRSRD